MKGLPKFLLPLLAVLVILGVVVYFAPKKSQEKSAGKFDWKVTQVTEKVPPPDYELDVFLSGEKIDDVQAVELDGNLDNTNIKLVSAESGGFYTNPLTIKMDTENLVFALAKNPSAGNTVDSTKPLLKLRFRSKTGFTQTMFSILPTSQIYVKEIGGTNPSVTQFTLQK